VNLQDLKNYIESLPKDKKFNYKLSEPFSWRGSYDEVAFSIEKEESTRELLLEQIEKALTGEFEGYKGGNYRYNGRTTVNFEEEESRFSDGSYVHEMLMEFLFYGTD
jgi:hypothetical protein